MLIGNMVLGRSLSWFKGNWGSKGKVGFQVTGKNCEKYDMGMHYHTKRTIILTSLEAKNCLNFAGVVLPGNLRRIYATYTYLDINFKMWIRGNMKLKAQKKRLSSLCQIVGLVYLILNKNKLNKYRTVVGK